LIKCFGEGSEQNSSLSFTRGADCSACISRVFPSFCSNYNTKLWYSLVLCKTKYIIFKGTKHRIVLYHYLIIDNQYFMFYGG
jgi:hypothetical protein